MPTSSLSLLMTLLLAQKTSLLEPLKCEEVQRIELSLTSPVPREVCVSPGLLTELFFDEPVSVEIQEEGRFEEISRERMSVKLRPPRDLAPGERLRLSVRSVDGRTRDTLVLVLVAAPGQSTRQVEVFHDTRTRESFEAELKQERAKSLRGAQELARVRFEFERFREQHGDSHQLRWLIASGVVDANGIQARTFKPSWKDPGLEAPALRKGISYRSADRVAIAVWLVNSSPGPWWVRSIRIRAGPLSLPVMGFWLHGATMGSEPFLFIVEADGRQLKSGEAVLTLADGKGTALTLSGIELP